MLQRTTNIKGSFLNKKLIVLIFATLITEILVSQESTIDTSLNYVIASGGLRLRDNPSKHAKTLLLLPFGSRVKYIDDIVYNLDSIIIKNRNNVDIYYGNWVKVKFNNTTGYVLDSYLYFKEPRVPRFDLKVNKEFLLLFPGCGCDPENLYDLKAWHLYGYYENKDGLFEVKKVFADYLSTKNYACEILITASNSKNLKFVIGTKEPQNVINGKISSTPIYYHYGEDLVSKYGLSFTDYPGDLILELNSKQQILNKKEFDIFASIDFIADLDGDKINDFIIGYGDKGHIKVLYLSSKARSKELLKIVAIFYAGYCC